MSYHFICRKSTKTSRITPRIKFPRSVFWAEDVARKHVEGRFRAMPYPGPWKLTQRVVPLTSVRRYLRVITVDHAARLSGRQNRKTRDNGRGRFHERLIFVSRDISRTRSIDLAARANSMRVSCAHAPTYATKRVARIDEGSRRRRGSGRRNGRPRYIIKLKNVWGRDREKKVHHTSHVRRDFLWLRRCSTSISRE